MNEKYTLEFTRKDIITILRGLNREVDARRDMQISFDAIGYRSGVIYCNRLKQLADKLIQKLLRLPDIADGYSDARSNDAGMEPAFVEAVMEIYSGWPTESKNNCNVVENKCKEECER